MQTSKEYFTTIVYANFGGQTEWIMGNWKIENWDGEETFVRDGPNHLCLRKMFQYLNASLD